MRLLATLPISLLFAFTPALALAQDAGSDAGLDDAGLAPDASPPNDTAERCLDGYDRRYVEACAGKEPGATCTFPGGEAGQCAALRCTDPGAQAICVATKGQPAPPPNLGDAGTEAVVDPAAVGGETIEGGGCVMHGRSSAFSGLWLAAVALLWRRRR